MMKLYQGAGSESGSMPDISGMKMPGGEAPRPPTVEEVD